MLIALLVLVVIVLVVAAVLAGMYNGLVQVRNHCEDAWANVQTELQRRYDLAAEV